MTEQKTQITQETLFNQLVDKYNLIYDIELDVKDILSEAKDAGVEDISLINAIAKAKAKNDLGDLEQKLKQKLEKIEELTS